MTFSKKLILLMFLTVITVKAEDKYILCAPQSLANACEQINRTEDITCVVVKNSIDCTNLVDNGKATMALVTAEEAMLASTFVNNVAVLGEFRDPIRKRNTEIETIVIVNKEINNFSLKGKKYCHPGLNLDLISPAVLTEFETKVLTENNVQTCGNRDTTLAENYIIALNNYFGPSCRPGEWVIGNKTLDDALKTKYSQLLNLCDRPAYEENSYFPYLQSLNCVLNGDGDLGLTTINALKSDSARYENAVQNFALLCKNGTTVNISEECVWTRQPRSLLIVNINYVDRLSNDLRTWFSTSIYDDTLQLTSVTEPIDEETNSRALSDKQILPLKDILFPDPRFLLKIMPDYPVILKEYLKDFRDIPTEHSQICKESIKLCVLSNEEKKCRWLKQAALNYGVQPTINCIVHEDKTECISDLKAEKADIVVISDNMTYFANRNNLTILGFGEQQTKDMKRSVLIVNSMVVKSLDDLNNKRGCFSEYGDRAYLAFITKLKQKIWPDSSYYGQNLNNFLNESCMPGIQDDKGHEPYPIGLNDEQLCAVCIPSPDSDTRTTCKPNNSNDFYGNDGALRCLEHNVSNFSVLTLEDNIKLPNGVSIMCQNGSLATTLPIDDNCAFSVTIDDVIIGRRNNKKAKDIVLLLEELDQRFALQSRSPFKIFDMFGESKDLIFKDITTGLEIAFTTNNKIMKTQLLMYEEIPHLREATSHKPDPDSSCSVIASHLVLFITAFVVIIQTAT